MLLVAPRRSASTTARPVLTRSLSYGRLAALAIALAGGLGGCGTINEKLGAGMGDYIPQAAGGLPANAPPRRGSARYDAYMKELERRRSLPAAEREAAEKADPMALGGAN